MNLEEEEKGGTEKKSGSKINERELLEI